MRIVTISQPSISIVYKTIVPGVSETRKKHIEGITFYLFSLILRNSVRDKTLNAECCDDGYISNACPRIRRADLNSDINRR